VNGAAGGSVSSIALLPDADGDACDLTGTFAGLDQLATMVAVVRPDGHCLRANASLEDVTGLSRRALQRTRVQDWLVDPLPLADALVAVSTNEVACGRFDALMQRGSSLAGGSGELPMHVIVSQTDWPGHVLVEMIEIEQQTRLDREERTHEQAQANKELVRNLAHEIRNPLGGIRGAAQLIQMELAPAPDADVSDDAPAIPPAGEWRRGVSRARELTEYTQVIIHEADRLQALVDRLLAPHRRPHVVGDVNIHEICERVRALILAEFPRGIFVLRDYDISIPEFRGDREQLIQATLNIARNACEAMQERIAAGDAALELRTRIARQVTIGKQRWRLALELHIEDNGPGVPESIRDRIFDPLVTGREGGSGLGLTLAQTFVQQHQGTIECDSAPGRTVFTVLIPLP
jgi:two-component system nitrogen regulation sensor histidine kinase GlnL